MFAIAIKDENLEVIAALNNGVKPAVQVPHEFFVYTDQSTPTYICASLDFKILAHDNDLAPVDVPVWTI